MGKTVTASFTVVFDTLAEYQEGATNLSTYETTPGNDPVTDKVLDEQALTISYTVTSS